MSRPRFYRYEVAWILALLLLATGVYLPGLYSQAIWYDEAITLLETAGHASPIWPSRPVPAEVAKAQFVGTPSLDRISNDLRQGDIHPPVYYWILTLWRQNLGFSLETARAFSLLCSIGTILMLYLLLRAGRVEWPLVPTAVYALSTGAVYMSQEARGYALASLLVTTSAFLAYRSWAVASNKQYNAVAYALAMAVCCGLAFQTNYLTLFPIGVILLWFSVNLYSFSRSLAILTPLVAICFSTLGFPTLLEQLDARPYQFVGFVGFFEEIQTMRKLILQVIWKPDFLSAILGQWIQKGPTVLIGMLLSLSLFQFLSQWHVTNRKLWLLLLGLTGAPLVGIVLLDFLFNKHLHHFIYLIFAGPALACVAAYGIMHLLSSQRWVGMVLLVILLSVQLASVNWGSTQRLRGHRGIDMRSLAKTIYASSSPSHVVVIGRGDKNEPGHPGAVVYELEPQTIIVILSPENNIEELIASLEEYEEVWLIHSVDYATAEIEHRFLDRLQQSGCHRVILHQWPATHFRKVRPLTSVDDDSFKLARASEKIIRLAVNSVREIGFL